MATLNSGNAGTPDTTDVADADGILYRLGMPSTPRRKTGEIRITGLDEDEELTIRLAAVRARKTLRQWALDHALTDVGSTRAPEAPHGS